jgi:predicted anti-sigma-YlaC factor YlaD
MRCETVKELLEAYVEGELDESIQEELEAHIADCQLCKQELALARIIPRLICSLATPPVPEDIIPSTLKRLHETPAVRRQWLRVFGALISRRWQFVAVSSFLLLIILFGIGYQRINRWPEITDAEVESAVEEIKFALGIMTAATREVQIAALAEGARILEITGSKSRDAMQTINKAQIEVSEKLRRNLAALAKLKL